MNKTLIVIVIILLTFVACEKKSLPERGGFIGTWIAADKTDTLLFIDDHTFEQVHYRGLSDFAYSSYAYSYTEDSITIQYKGPLDLFAHPSTHYYTLTSSKLIINFRNIDYSKGQYGFDKVVKEYVRSVNSYY